MNITKTENGLYQIYSELHGRFLTFDDKKTCSIYLRYLQKIESYFNNPTSENRQERINFCNSENLFLNIE
jgi:hypothetical protein